jgi:hypothetical protein
MASAALSRRAGKVVAYPPLCELSDLQPRQFHEMLLDADTFEGLPGKWQAAILKAEENRPNREVAGGNPEGRAEPAPPADRPRRPVPREFLTPARQPGRAAPPLHGKERHAHYGARLCAERAYRLEPRAARCVRCAGRPEDSKGYRAALGEGKEGEAAAEGAQIPSSAVL